MTATWLYNGIMLVADAGAVALLARPRGRVEPRLFFLFFALLPFGLGSVLGENRFGILRLWSYGLFAHGSLMLLAAGCYSWRRSRTLSVVLLLSALSLVAVAGHSFLIEPRWLEISHYRLRSEKIHQPVLIAVVSDLQTDRPGAYEERVLREVRDHGPDMILLTGDYLQLDDAAAWRREAVRFRDLWRRAGLVPRLGAYAVQGNVEPAGWPSLFDGTSVVAAIETSTYALPGLSLTALSLFDSFATTLVQDTMETYQIVFGHAPDFALGQVEADLMVAGHTHGGQVRLPFLGPLITYSAVPRSWASGLTSLDAGRRLIVSRGIGMERGNAPRLRFLCRPELVFVELLPAVSGGGEP